MTDEREDRRVDDLRQRLRSLGYLEAGVDRYVLAGARARRRASAIAWLTSLRIGVLAALLMGPAAAIGISQRLPGLITGSRDGFVIAAYIGAVFGGGIALTAVAAIAVVSWTGSRSDRRRRIAALIAGFIVAFLSVAYLTMWWDASTLSSRSGSWGALWTPVALAFAAAISVLIGHTVTIAALAVSVARAGTTGEAYGVPGASWRVMGAAGLVIFCGALLLFSLVGSTEGGHRETPPIAVISSGLRVRLIAIDGFDPELATRLASAGRLPALNAALQLDPIGEDSHTADEAEADRRPIGRARAAIQFGETRDPARAWTTIATGQPAATHAVRSLETRRVIGLQGTLDSTEPSPLARALAAATDLVRLTHPAVASGAERRVRSLWEVASGAGLRTVVINWWATWPAPVDAGIVLTDRATLRLERGGELDAEIAPVALYEVIRARWPALRREAAERAARLETPLLRRSAELDALQLAITGQVSGTSTDLVCSYLAGLDVVQHGLLAASDLSGSSPSTMAARLATLEQYYVYLDGLLAPFLTPAHDELLMIVTGPGRVQAGAAGMVAIRGHVVNAFSREAVAQPVDIMPTVLHALGIPISRELPGRTLIELFAGDFARRYPVREISTYGTPSPNRTPRGGQPLDQEMIDRLRSLGYLR